MVTMPARCSALKHHDYLQIQRQWLQMAYRRGRKHPYETTRMRQLPPRAKQTASQHATAPTHVPSKEVLLPKTRWDEMLDTFDLTKKREMTPGQLPNSGRPCTVVAPHGQPSHSTSSQRSEPLIATQGQPSNSATPRRSKSPVPSQGQPSTNASPAVSKPNPGNVSSPYHPPPDAHPQRTQADIKTQHLQTKWEWFRHGAVLLPPQGKGAQVDAVIVVEGMMDARVVGNAVCAPVLVVKGAKIGMADDHPTAQFIRKVAGLAQCIIITDCDGAGYSLRQLIVRLSGPSARHVFLPVAATVSTQSSKQHGVGNIGIQNASVSCVADAIAQCRDYTPWLPSQEGAFSSEDLLKQGLWNAIDTAVEDAAKNKLRRAVVCNYLGLPSLSGKRLLSALNCYCFSANEVPLPPTLPVLPSALCFQLCFWGVCFVPPLP
jgi:5S rRNA maturation endonuclease (ribonuclease M5)